MIETQQKTEKTQQIKKDSGNRMRKRRNQSERGKEEESMRKEDKGARGNMETVKKQTIHRAEQRELNEMKPERG